jgi:uncharacterized protein (TIGR00290 family)
LAVLKAKTFLNWSTGKDSALALYHLLRDASCNVEGLLTSVNSSHDRVSMHGIRRALLQTQIAALGLPVTTVELPEQPSMADYDAKMSAAIKDLKAQGYVCAAFGDIFLEDLRQYRENKLTSLGVTCRFPLWKRDTRELLQEFISLNFKAVVVCVNAQALDETFVGRDLDVDFLNDLPTGVDACGENGEFHTFCYDGPIFRQPVAYTLGEKLFREYGAPAINNDPCGDTTNGFWFIDLLPG